MINRKVRIFIVVGIVFAFCLMMFACSSPGASTTGSAEEQQSTGDETTTAASFTWTADTDCSLCHERSSSSLASLGCEAAKGEPNTTCMTCHADAANVEAAHAGLTLQDTVGDQSGLKKSKVQDSTCISCHSSQDDLIAATADVSLVDDKGTEINPHAVTTQYNIEGAHNSITCSNCHRMHLGEDTATTASRNCLSCHHDGVFECYTCHD